MNIIFSQLTSWAYVSSKRIFFEDFKNKKIEYNKARHMAADIGI